MNNENKKRRLAPPTQGNAPPVQTGGNGKAQAVSGGERRLALPTQGNAPPVQTGGNGKASTATGGGEKVPAVIHRMTRRCFGWDYKGRAIYQITLVQRNRCKPLLASIEIADGHGGWVSTEEAKKLGLNHNQIVARAKLTPLGEAIYAHWKRIGNFTPEIRPLYCQIMPDHLHVILDVTRPMAKPLGNAISGFKTGCEKNYRKFVSTDEGQLWEEGYQDSILFNDGQLDNMFNYLRDNPRRLALKWLNPDLFRVINELRMNLPLASQKQNVGLQVSGEGSSAVPMAQAVGYGYFATLGNRFLLDGPMVQVQVSRQDFHYKRETKIGGGYKIARDKDGVPLVDFKSDEFDEKCEYLLFMAKRGMTLISPCVSDGEREIARYALEAGFKLITMVNKGFSVFQKPDGRYFNACVEGRLLIITPITWSHEVGERPMTREDAMILNRLVQVLAGAGAAEINYHGVTFDHIDTMAFKAVRGEYENG